MSTIPSSPTDRLELLRHHIQILLNQYGSILHSSSPHAVSTVHSTTDEAKLRSATLAITSSIETLLRLVQDLRIDSTLLLYSQYSPDLQGSIDTMVPSPEVPHQQVAQSTVSRNNINEKSSGSNGRTVDQGKMMEEETME